MYVNLELDSIETLQQFKRKSTWCQRDICKNYSWILIQVTQKKQKTEMIVCSYKCSRVAACIRL